LKIELTLNPAWRRHLAPGDRRLWLFRSIALRIEIRAVSLWAVEIFWKRLLAGALAFLIIGYLGSVTALYLWLDKRPQNLVTWSDVAWAPVKWDNFRRKRGDTAIEQARIRLQKGDYVEAFYGLRVGLSRSPANASGRTLLAQLYAASDPAQALRLMEDGIEHSPHDLDYLRALFSFYARFGSLAHAERQAERLLAWDRPSPLPSRARQRVQTLLANLLLESAPDRAERILAEVGSTGDDEEDANVSLLRASALVRLGRMDEARTIIRMLRETAPALEVARLEAKLAEAVNDTAALESALRRMKAAAPESPLPHIVAFSAWHRLKRLTLRDAAEQEFLRTFGADDPAMQTFAANAVNIGAPDAVQRAQQVARRNRRSDFAFRVHLTELALRQGDFDGAFRRLREWERSIDTLPAPQRAYPELIERLTRVMVAGGGNQVSGLVAHLGAMRGRATPTIYDLVLETLERSSNLEASRQVLQIGLRLFPHADVLLARSARLAEASAREHGIPISILSAQVLPASAEEALAELDSALAAQSYSKCRELLRSIRAGRPPWLVEAEPQFSVRNVQLAILTLDPFAARVIARGHVEKYRDYADLQPLIRFAGDLLEQGRVREARLVHDEIAAGGDLSASVRFALSGLNLPDDSAAQQLKSAEIALAALDRLLAERQPDEAADLLAQIKQKPPAWIVEARMPLAAREVRVRLALRQRPLALTVFKDLVLRPGPPHSAAFKLVRDFLADGDAEHALLLARELSKLLPDDAEAGRLLAEAEAPRPVGN
jgi:hypothetical protein